jgi:uncharacterized membrane protein YGL010W
VDPFVERMAAYAAEHRQTRTRLTHFIGVPLIVFAVLVLLAMVPIDLGPASADLALVLVAVALGAYAAQHAAVGTMLAVLVLPLFLLAEWLAAQPPARALGWALGLFVVGWAVQLVGHRFEGNRPAFLDNLAHLVIAPAYLTAELLFALGLEDELRARIERRVTARDAGGAAAR